MYIHERTELIFCRQMTLQKLQGSISDGQSFKLMISGGGGGESPKAGGRNFYLQSARKQHGAPVDLGGTS